MRPDHAPSRHTPSPAVRARGRYPRPARRWRRRLPPGRPQATDLARSVHTIPAHERYPGAIRILILAAGIALSWSAAILAIAALF